MSTTPEGESTFDQLAAGWADWVQVYELLKAGQYQQVAELLDEAQTASQQRGDAGLAQILAAAQRICLACSQSREEAEWHRQATQEARQRKRDLEQQLYALLILVHGDQTPKTQEISEGAFPSALAAEAGLKEDDTAESSEHQALWQRIQEFIGRRPSSQSPEKELPEMPDVAPSVSSTDETEILAALPHAQNEPTTTSLVAYCLGPFRVTQNDRPITEWSSFKAKSIFKYLLAHPQMRIAKDVLMDIFWPDATPRAARRNLHQAIYALRQTLRGEQPEFQHIRFEDDCYLLNPEMDIWLDSDEFEKHVQAGHRLEAAGQLEEAIAEFGVAEGLYQGDFLEEDLYEDWPQVQREHIRNTYWKIVGRLSEYYVDRGEYTAAIALCQKVLAQDNCSEEAHRRLMECFLAQGQRHLAVRQYQNCVEVLKQELDLTPSEETVALYRRITDTT